MTSFILKIIACITMVCDHVQYLFPQFSNNITFFIGRLSFPIFAFLIVEGYIHTSNLKKYIMRLFIFALISQVPFMLFRTLVGEYKLLNILFTFLFGIGCIYSYDKISNKVISCIMLIVILLSTCIIKVDYGLYGVLTVFILFVFKDSKIFSIFAIILNVLLNFYMNNLLIWNIKIILSFIAVIFSSIMVLFLYNGKEGKKLKYFYYFFYPIHMLIIYILSKILFF